MYGYFTNKNKHMLLVKNKHKYMAIYYKNRFPKRISFLYEEKTLELIPICKS